MFFGMWLARRARTAFTRASWGALPAGPRPRCLIIGASSAFLSVWCAPFPCSLSSEKNRLPVPASRRP